MDNCSFLFDLNPTLSPVWALTNRGGFTPLTFTQVEPEKYLLHYVLYVFEARSFSKELGLRGFNEKSVAKRRSHVQKGLG